MGPHWPLIGPKGISSVSPPFRTLKCQRGKSFGELILNPYIISILFLIEILDNLVTVSLRGNDGNKVLVEGLPFIWTSFVRTWRLTVGLVSEGKGFIHPKVELPLRNQERRGIQKNRINLEGIKLQ